MVMKNRIQTAPVIKRERNGRRMSPFSLRRTPRLTFVSCQPTRSRSRNPSFRGAGEYGEDGTVGVGAHMGIGRSCGVFHLNPPPESRYGESRTVAAETPGEGIRWAREPGEVRVRRLYRPGPFLDHGLLADLHRPVRELCRQPVAAVVLAARVAVIPDADAPGTVPAAL